MSVVVTVSGVKARMTDLEGNLMGTDDEPLAIVGAARIPIADAKLTIGDESVGFSDIPEGARTADVTFDGPVRYRLVGEDVTADGVGQIESVGLEFDTPLGDVRMIRLGTEDVTAEVVFYA